MCGIAGIFNGNGAPASPVLVRAMGHAIAHRGPDGDGCFTDRFVGLAHRRLAILDLTPAAHQPMATTDGQAVLTYNGEVYNYQELRTELEALGHRFRSSSDSEVVLEAYREWGSACVERFNGMFAFAVWDRARQELFLARDRYGIKPLYTTWIGETLLFGSEVKAFLPHPAFTPAMDEEALLEYMTFQNFFTDRTLFSGVRMLPAGTTLTVRPGQRAEPRRYWDYAFTEPDGPVDEDELVEELDRLFQQAVQRHLVSDVELGSYLSSGMDSGSITALAARDLGPGMKTFTCGFDLHSASGLELNFDERDKAEHLSYLLKTQQYEMVLKAGDMERVLPAVVWHLEEPRVGQSYPNYFAAHLASKFVKVVLAGTGGDELFAGYPWRYYRAAVNTDFEHYIDKYYLYWQRLIPNQAIKELFAPIYPRVKHVWTRDIMHDVFTAHAQELTRPEDYVNHSLYLEAKTFLHGLLVVEDKLSMAHGLESRVPFLDNDLVDFAMKLPAHLKLGNLGEVVRLNENEPGPKTTRFFERTRDGKLILRKVMSRHIPSAVTDSVKQGFSGPDATWFRGESIDYVRRALFARDCPLYDYFDRDALKGLVDEHLDGKRNRRLLVWSLIYLDHWCRTFLGSQRPSDPGPGI